MTVELTFENFHQNHVGYDDADTLQHPAAPCSTLQHAATRCNTLQHTATHCNTLQHTVTHCNTLQHYEINQRADF